MSDLAVILPAAGSSRRFGANKLLMRLDSRGTVLERVIQTFWSHDAVGGIFLATDNADVLRLLTHLPEEIREDLHICAGGPNRAASVQSALRSVPHRFEWVAVHDAARPLISAELIDRTLQAARKHGSAAPALPVHLTIKESTSPLPAPVIRTIPRDRLFAMQTPQIFRRADLAQAFENCPLPLENITDDLQLLELAGKPVWLVEGEERNLKITTPQDLKLAQLLLQP